MSVNSKMTAIADKIRLYLMTEDKYTLDDMAQSVDAVYNKGNYDGYEAGKVVGVEEGISIGKAEAETEKLVLSMSLSEALTSGSENVMRLETNINQAKSDIGAIKTLIENHGVEVPVGTPSNTYDETIEQIIADEKAAGVEDYRQTQYDEFWDGIQSNGTRSNYEYAFMGESWKYNALKPKYLPITPQFAGHMFERCGATNVDLTDVVKITWNCWGYVDMCANFTGLVKFGDFICSHNNCQGVFMGCTNLASVKSFTSTASTAFTSTFYNCKALTDITFAGTIANSFDIRYSPLNKASIESLIGCLSTTATGNTLMLKQTAKEAAFTDEEWIALITPKSNQYDGNWTISLV